MEGASKLLMARRLKASQTWAPPPQLLLLKQGGCEPRTRGLRAAQHREYSAR